MNCVKSQKCPKLTSIHNQCHNVVTLGDEMDEMGIDMMEKKPPIGDTQELGQLLK